MKHRRLLALGCLGLAVAAGCGSGGVTEDPVFDQRPSFNDDSPPLTGANEVGTQSPSSAEQSPALNDNGLGGGSLQALCIQYCDRLAAESCGEESQECHEDCSEIAAVLEVALCSTEFQDLLVCALTLPLVDCEIELDETVCVGEFARYLQCVGEIDVDPDPPANCTPQGDCVCENACRECLCQFDNDADICAFDCEL